MLRGRIKGRKGKMMMISKAVAHLGVFIRVA